MQGVVREQRVHHGAENHERHETHAKADGEVESQIVGSREATKEKCTRSGGMRGEPTHGRRHQDAVPDRALGTPCGVAVLNQPTTSHGHGNENPQPNGKYERAAHQSTSERRRVLAKKEADSTKDRRPQGGAEHVEHREPCQTHGGDASKWRDEHARHREESANDYRAAPVPVEEPARGGEHLGVHLLCVPFKEVSSATTEQERDGGSERGRHGGHEKQQHDRQPAVRSERGGRHERCVGGEGNGDPFRKDEQCDDQVPVVADEAADVRDHRLKSVFMWWA